MACSKCEQERLRLISSQGPALPPGEQFMKLFLVKTEKEKLGFCISADARNYATSHQLSRFGTRDVHVRNVDGVWSAVSPLPPDIVLAEGQTCLSV